VSNFKQNMRYYLLDAKHYLVTPLINLFWAFYFDKDCKVKS